MNTGEAIPIDEIDLDTSNPRIKQFLEMYTVLSDESMVLALGGSSDEEADSTSMGSYQRLKHSIKASGGIIQPIIVNRNEDGRYRCVEGNTRVAIYRQLRREDRAGGLTGEKWDLIPATIRDQMDEHEVHKIRLQVHLVGNRQWDPYSKGKYLNELVADYKMPLSELVEYCGGSRSDIQQAIAAYRDMELHYRPVTQDRGSDFDPRRFSAFVELQRPGIKEAIYNAGFNEQDFSGWVEDEKLVLQNHVRKLPQILDNPETKNIFLKRGSREAINALHVPALESTLKESSILQLSQVLKEKLDLISYEDAEEFAGNPNSDEYMELEDLIASLGQLLHIEIISGGGA